MDLGTHALASLAVARAAMPGKPQRAWVVVMAAGMLADIDALSAFFGPAAYLHWHDAFLHSLAVSLGFAALLSAACFLPARRPAAAPPGLFLFAAVWLAAGIHLAMDACQANGVMLFWPFSTARIALDWSAGVDPSIIAVLAAALFLPELLRLVGDEIGSKAKKPRGRASALVGLALVLLYTGVRANFHSHAIAALQARTYGGEFPRQVAAFPDSISLFSWHGIVETEGALREVTVDASEGARFDAESGVTLFKPEPSAALERARQTSAAKAFLQRARFPKATVQKTAAGYEVEIRDLRFAAAQETHHEIAAIIETDSAGNILDDRLLWARLRHPR